MIPFLAAVGLLTLFIGTVYLVSRAFGAALAAADQKHEEERRGDGER